MGKLKEPRRLLILVGKGTQHLLLNIQVLPTDQRMHDGGEIANYPLA